MNILIDTEIWRHQSAGGISKLWRSLLPELHRAMPDCTFDSSAPPTVFLSTYYARAPLGVKSVAMVYDLIGLQYPLIDHNRADMVDLRQAVKEASALISISQGVAADVKRLLGRDSTVAYCGLEAGYGKVTMQEIDAFQRFVGKPYILVVGRRGLYKNVQALYQAWRLWEGRHTHRIVCIGGETLLPQDEAFAKATGDTWLHLATLEDRDLQAAYAGATALCYPSIMEGFGLPMVEAMACACPVVCDHAMHEIAGDAAYYCDVSRPKQLAEVLTATLDMSVRTDRVVAGTQWVKRYTWASMAQTVADAIRSVA